MMRRRNEAVVYYDKEINIENTLAYLKSKKVNSGEDPERFTLFSLILTAALKIGLLYPQLNRFIHRRALYQRNHICFSYIVRQEFALDAAEVNAKIFSMSMIRSPQLERRLNKPI